MILNGPGKISIMVGGRVVGMTAKPIHIVTENYTKAESIAEAADIKRSFEITGIPSIRKEMNPLRFVATRLWAARGSADRKTLDKEQSQECVSDSCKATPDSHSDTVQPKGMETSPIVTSEKVKKSQPQQLTLW